MVARWWRRTNSCKRQEREEGQPGKPWLWQCHCDWSEDEDQGGWEKEFVKRRGGSEELSKKEEKKRRWERKLRGGRLGQCWHWIDSRGWHQRLLPRRGQSWLSDLWRQLWAGLVQLPPDVARHRRQRLHQSLHRPQPHQKSRATEQRKTTHIPPWSSSELLEISQMSHLWADISVHQEQAERTSSCSQGATERLRKKEVRLLGLQEVLADKYFRGGRNLLQWLRGRMPDTL